MSEYMTDRMPDKMPSVECQFLFARFRMPIRNLRIYVGSRMPERMPAKQWQIPMEKGGFPEAKGPEAKVRL